MTITRRDPNTIWLGGPRTELNTEAAEEALTPGQLVERHNNAGVWRWRKHATAGGDCARQVVTEANMLNKGVSDAYAIGDLVEVSQGAGGTNFWMFIASGQTITFGQRLESAGDGTLRALASGVALFQALESKTATALTRIRVEVI